MYLFIRLNDNIGEKTFEYIFEKKGDHFDYFPSFCRTSYQHIYVINRFRTTFETLAEIERKREIEREREREKGREREIWREGKRVRE